MGVVLHLSKNDLYIMTLLTSNLFQKFSQQYAPWIAPLDTAIVIALMRIPSYIIVLNTLVPISLYVRSVINLAVRTVFSIL
jgi:hypothetical protein